jgi:hypothetical protein
VLRARRVFFDLKLHDWVVRHDLDGDGMLLKTQHARGVGYDRPFNFDEITVDIRAYQVSPGNPDTVLEHL